MKLGIRFAKTAKKSLLFRTSLLSTSISRIRSVIAIEKTASQNAVTLFFSQMNLCLIIKYEFSLKF